MAKGQTKQATQMSKDIYSSAPRTFSPVTQPLTGVPAEARAGYEDLYKTGGLNTSDVQSYMDVAGQSIAANNSVLQEQLNRQRAAQGEGAGGGEYLALARQAANQQSDAYLRASVEAERIRSENQQAGLRGLAGLDQQLLQALGLQVGSQEEATAIMQNLSKNPGIFGNILNALSSVTGSYKSAPEGSTWAIGA